MLAALQNILNAFLQNYGLSLGELLTKGLFAAKPLIKNRKGIQLIVAAVQASRNSPWFMQNRTELFLRVVLLRWLFMALEFQTMTIIRAE